MTTDQSRAADVLQALSSRRKDSLAPPPTRAAGFTISSCFRTARIIRILARSTSG